MKPLVKKGHNIKHQPLTIKLARKYMCYKKTEPKKKYPVSCFGVSSSTRVDQ